MESNDTFVTELLESGVRVVGQPMAGVESAALGILVGAGARNESEGLNGISHFVEQMLFRGTKSYDARRLSEQFDSLGISYDSSAGIEMSLVNAVLLGDRANEALDLLSEVAINPTFPEDDVENVRSLLLQEIQQREDHHAQKAFDLVRQQFFAGSSLGNDVLGAEETITAITRDDLIGYWRGRYTANNMLVSIAGKFDWDAVIERLRAITRTWPSGEGRAAPESPAARSGSMVVHRDTAQQHIGFAMPGVPVSDPEYYTTALFATVLGGPAVSRLWREVREKRGLAYSVSARFDGMEQTGIIRIYVGTSSDRAHESVEVVLGELHRLSTAPVTSSELDLAKTRLKSQFVMRSESTSARMVSNLRSWWFEGILRDLEDVKSRIDAVTISDIARLVERLDVTQHLTAVALGPRSEEELFGIMLARS